MAELKCGSKIIWTIATVCAFLVGIILVIVPLAMGGCSCAGQCAIQTDAAGNLIAQDCTQFLGGCEKGVDITKCALGHVLGGLGGGASGNSAATSGCTGSCSSSKNPTQAACEAQPGKCCYWGKDWLGTEECGTHPLCYSATSEATCKSYTGCTWATITTNSGTATMCNFKKCNDATSKSACTSVVVKGSSMKYVKGDLKVMNKPANSCQWVYPRDDAKNMACVSKGNDYLQQSLSICPTNLPEAKCHESSSPACRIDAAGKCKSIDRVCDAADTQAKCEGVKLNTCSWNAADGKCKNKSRRSSPPSDHQTLRRVQGNFLMSTVQMQVPNTHTTRRATDSKVCSQAECKWGGLSTGAFGALLCIGIICLIMGCVFICGVVPCCCFDSGEAPPAQQEVVVQIRPAQPPPGVQAEAKAQ